MPAMLSMVQICCPGAFLGVEFPSAGLDAGGSEQNHPNQNRCKEFAACLQPGKAACSTYPLCPISRVRMLQTKWASAPRKIETALGFVVLESYGAPAIIDCSGQIPKHRHAEDARKPHSHRVAHLLEADC